VFFFLSKILDLAFAPIAWAVALLGLGLALVWRRSPRRRLSLVSLGGALAILLVAGNPTLANRIWWTLERDAPDTHRADREYDSVVLLGGLIPSGAGDPAELARYGDGVERLLVTYDLLRTGRARTAIISGGVPNAPAGALVEAELIARQLEAWGIARERIVVDGKALNTRQNAIETARIVRERGDATVLVVTSAFHMQRALGCFRDVELAVDTLPVDRRASAPETQPWLLAPRSDALDMTSAALRELSGRLVYRLLGYTR